MGFIGSVSYFVMFVGQSSKNFHDVLKVYLETTVCVCACFVEYSVFVFDAIDVYVLNSYAKIFWLEKSGYQSK